MAFATVDELATYLGRPLTEAEEDQAALLLELATGIIRREAGQTLSLATTTAKLAGTWAMDLELPERPVVSVAAVSVNGIALAAGAWSWNTRALLRRASSFQSGDLTFESSDDWVGPGAQGAVGVSGGHWGGPAATVEVTYTHGYDDSSGSDDVPSDLKAVALAMVRRGVVNPTGVRQESLGTYSVTFATAVDGVMLSGDERRLIRSVYRKRYAQ